MSNAFTLQAAEYVLMFDLVWVLPNGGTLQAVLHHIDVPGFATYEEAAKAKEALFHQQVNFPPVAGATLAIVPQLAAYDAEQLDDTDTLLDLPPLPGSQLS
jgi:hypothetical protein